MIPSDFIRWALPITALGIACMLTTVEDALITGAFTIRNFYPIFAKDPGTGEVTSLSVRTKKLSGGSIVMLLILASEVALACIFKFVLMHYPEIVADVVTTPPSSSNTTTNATKV
jgi:hypothetical protein